MRRESVLDSFVDCRHGNSKAFGPCLYRERNPFVVQHHPEAGFLWMELVRVLLGTSRPPAVVFGIVPVVVTTIKRHSFWSLAHVDQEAFKRRAPLSANRNAAATIFVKVGVLLVFAPVNHGGPRSVRRSPSHPMRSFPLGVDLLCNAAAGSRLASHQRAAVDKSLISAIANAPPLDPLVWYAMHFNSQQPIELLTSQIGYFHALILLHNRCFFLPDSKQLRIIRDALAGPAGAASQPARAVSSPGGT